MKILTISSLYPPHSHGGAENSAANLARWLARQGNSVHALAASLDDTDQPTSESVGVRVHRPAFPRPYPVFEFLSAPTWKKPLWHLQDSLDPRNRSIVGKCLDEVKPDVALVHYLPGIGYNALSELSRRKIPTVYYLHDLGLACTRMSMFRNGQDCAAQCLNCKVSSSHRMGMVREFERIGFSSPSRANLQRLQKLLPLHDYPSSVIPNANFYPEPTVERVESDVLRVLYVGRLHPQKGVELVLRSVQELSAKHEIQIRIVGGGQIEQELRARYGHRPWCSFTGHVTAESVSNEMINADVLVVPSVWLENAPGVAIQALSLGLPVLGSDVGGIPELVDDEQTGMLVPVGDQDAWTRALQRVVDEPETLARWRAHAMDRAGEYEQNAVGRRHLEFIDQVMSGKGVANA